MILRADNLTNLDKVIKFGLPASFADIKNRSIQFRSDMHGMFIQSAKLNGNPPEDETIPLLPAER